LIDHLEALLEEQEQPEEEQDVLRLPVEGWLPGGAVELEENVGEASIPAAGQAADGEAEATMRAAGQAEQLARELGQRSAALLEQRVARAAAGESRPPVQRTVVEVRERETAAPAVDIRALDRQFRLDARRYDGDLSHE